MSARLGWSAAALTACVAVCGAAALFAQDKDGDAPKPAPAKTLKAGDEVEVVITLHAAVAADGSVSVPGIGKVDAAGKTTRDLASALTEQAAAIGAACEVRQTEVRRVFLIGAVHEAVEMPADRESRYLDVLAKIDPSALNGADLAHLRVRRLGGDGKPFMFAVNADAVVDSSRLNIALCENDIVIVPKLDPVGQASEFVYVLGAVASPGRQPIVKGKTPFTLTKLFALCGNVQDIADVTHVKIIRAQRLGRMAIDVDFAAILKGVANDLELLPDDLVYVPERK